MKLISHIARLELLPEERSDLLAHVKKRNTLIERCRKLAGRRQVMFVEQVLLKSLSLRVCVAIRVLRDRSTFGDVLKLATSMKLSRASSELMKSELRSKEGSRTEFRTITRPGILRRARQMLVRDALEVLSLGGKYDYASKGGERALVEDVTEAIEDRGHKWVGSIDIKACYPSIGPKHLSDALPSREVAKECIRISTTSAGSASPSALTTTTRSTNPPQNQVRPGLSQGSLISPLLARIVIAKVLDGCTVPAAARVFCFVDNIYITAPSRKDCEAAMQAIQRGFADNQAGRMICHKRRVWNAFSRRAQVLGYILEPARNNGRMHRKPGPERCRRYRQRLFAKISRTANVRQQFKIAEEYVRCWFNAQAGWTKVAGHSWDSALTCAYLYVDDIRCGVIGADGKFKNFPIISAPG